MSCVTLESHPVQDFFAVAPPQNNASFPNPEFNPEFRVLPRTRVLEPPLSTAKFDVLIAIESAVVKHVAHHSVFVVLSVGILRWS